MWNAHQWGSCKACCPLPLGDTRASNVIISLAIVCLELLPARHAGRLVRLLRLLRVLRVLLSSLGSLLEPIRARIIQGRARGSSMLLAWSAVIAVGCGLSMWLVWRGRVLLCLLLLAMVPVVMRIGAMVAAPVAACVVLGSAILWVTARLGWLGRRGHEAGVCRVVHLDKGVCVGRAGVAPLPSKARGPDSGNACKQVEASERSSGESVYMMCRQVLDVCQRWPRSSYG